MVEHTPKSLEVGSSARSYIAHYHNEPEVNVGAINNFTLLQIDSFLTPIYISGRGLVRTGATGAWHP